MASGDTLLTFMPFGYEPPASNPATPDERNAHPTLDFADATNNEAAIWTLILPLHYAGGGLTVTVMWSASTATTGKVKWDGFIERIADVVFDIDADGFAVEMSVTATAANVSGEAAYDDITFTDGAQMDSLAAGELFRFKLERDQADAADTMSGDAELLSITIKET